MAVPSTRDLVKVLHETQPCDAFVPKVSFSSIAIVESSETLKARARAIRDELTQTLAVALADSADRESTDPDARLAATLILATWTVAFIEAHRSFRQTKDTLKATALFLDIVDRGMVGVKAAMARTPYGQRPARVLV